MKTAPSGAQCAARPTAGTELQREANQENAKLNFDTLVARYYPAIHGFASRLTDDPREAIALTRDAFNSTRKQMQTRSDGNVFASVLISNVIRAGLTAA